MTRSWIYFVCEQIFLELLGFVGKKFCNRWDKKVGFTMKKKSTVVNLFAGEGGLSKAFLNAGAEIVYATGIDADACRIYNYNIQSVICEREHIQNVIIDSIPDADIMVGRLPCQKFSVSGCEKYEDTEWLELLKIVEAKRPRVICFETASLLSFMNSGKTGERLVDKLKQIGYFVKWQHMNLNEYGNMPLSKRRLYIVAFKEKDFFDDFEFPSKVQLTKSAFEIINIKDKKSDKYYSGGNIRYILSNNSIEIQTGVFYQLRNEPNKGLRLHMSDSCSSLGLNTFYMPLTVDKFGLRRLTPEECFKLQGFFDMNLPDDIGDNVLYKYARTCSPVALAERVAINILTALNERSNLIDSDRNGKDQNTSLSERESLPRQEVSHDLKGDKQKNKAGARGSNSQKERKTCGVTVKNEEEFTLKMVIPALKKVGCFDVRYNHGSDEYGKDVIYKYRDNLQRTNLGAVQIKFGDISGEANGTLDVILNQIDDAFRMHYIDVSENREQNILQLLIICSGKYTRNAKEKILKKLDKGYDVRFWDGQDVLNILES